MQSKASLRRFLSSLGWRRILLRTVLFCALGMGLGTQGLAEDAFVRLNHSAPAFVANAWHLGRLDPTQTVRLAIALPLRNQAVLTKTLEQLYTPGDPLYHHFLTPDQFTEQFGPTQADYDAVADYFRGRGLTLFATHSNRALLDVEGPAAAVEAALRVQFHHFQAQDGHLFYAANAAPALPVSIAARISGVLGMDNARPLQPQVRFKPQAWRAAPNVIGTGPLGGLAPKDIKTAYRIDQAISPNSRVAPDGTGQNLALVELDGYSSTTIHTYERQFGLPDTPLVNINVDGGPPGIGQGEVEVALDIEMMVALAPKASAIFVYEGPNSGTALVDILHQIATDNRASVVSTSWGIFEDEFNDGGAFFHSEAAAFQQMAAQGQSMFAAAGDTGILDPNTLTVSALDPATQPFVTGVGGTTLSVVNPGVDEHYAGEKVWNDFNNSGAGGGGVSRFWPMPSYQTAVDPALNGGASTMRNVPDVCLNADPATGYDINSAVAGGWATVGGTSAAAPLWAAYTALINQARGSQGRIGFINPTVYGIYSGRFPLLPAASNAFHDVTTGNNDFFGDFGIFHAGIGYDNASGLGSMVGDQLFAHPLFAPISRQRITPIPTPGQHGRPIRR